MYINPQHLMVNKPKMVFKPGNLYRSLQDIDFVNANRVALNRLPIQKIAKGTILTFLKWDEGWLTKNVMVKHFLIDNMIVFDSAGSYHRPTEHFEEVKIDEI